MLRDGSVETESMWCVGAAADRRASASDAGYDEQCTALHRRLKRIVKARGALDAQEAAALRDAEALRMWRHYGYGSLLEYMELELGYAPRAALERLRVAKAIVDLPLIAEAMEQGDLSFSAGRELTRVATADTEGEWLEAANDKNLRQVEELVAGHDRGAKPSDPKDPSLRKHKLRFDDLDGETVALIRQARQILEREHGERLTDSALLRLFGRMIIDGAASPERTKAPYQIAVTLCTECKRGWQDGGGIAVEMSPPALETVLCDAQHIGSIDGDAEEAAPAPQDSGNNSEGSCATEPRGRDAESTRTQVAGDARTKAKRARSAIPPALRRRVKHRDHDKCRVPWCRSSINVDCHHIRPISEGGKHTFDNLLSLCESHHLAHHAGALVIEGTAASPAFRRREHHAFGTVERAIDTKRTLEALGFDKSEVTAAMHKTKTHVGTAELTLEQWIKIALSYCPKPRA